ncbi:hypothetical protein TNCV_545171 [Trichonephila clavipes]|nr:hypothetical protein TNCV_545171 [Trichonephila clavipes]
MMTKSVVSVATTVGYTHSNTPHCRIKEASNVSLRYSSSCGFHILPKLIMYKPGWCIPGSRCASMDRTFSIGERSGEQEDQGSNSM